MKKYFLHLLFLLSALSPLTVTTLSVALISATVSQSCNAQIGAQLPASGFNKNTYINPHQVNIVGKTELRLFGDSFTVGAQASPLSLGFANRIDDVYPQFTSVINYAENGRGVWRNCQLIQTASWTSGPTNLALINWMVGVNDLNDSGLANPAWEQTKNKVRNCTRCAMLKPLQAAVAASGSSSVTRSGGTFAGYNANDVGGRYQQLTLPNANAASFATAGVGATWSWTATFEHFYIQFIGASGRGIGPTTYLIGEADIFVDGVKVGHYSGNGQYDQLTDGVYDNGRGVACMAFWDFANASHTVQVIQTKGDGAMAIDFFAVITDNFTITPAFLVYEIPYLNPSGYSGGSTAASDILSGIMFEEMLFFKNRGYNYGWSYTNKYYTPVSPFVDPDNIHPSTDGHGQLLRGTIGAIISSVWILPFRIYRRREDFEEKYDGRKDRQAA